jgi:hypothetical protein
MRTFNFILVFIAATLLACRSTVVRAGVPGGPADTLSFETSQPITDVFRAGLKALKALEIKVVKKNNYDYIKAGDSTSRITSLKQIKGVMTVVGGTSTVLKVAIRLESVSKKETRVHLYVSKTKYELTEKGPKLVSVDRQGDLEKQIRSKMEQILAK